MISFLKKKASQKCGRARDRKTTESLLLLAASRLFAQKGYEKTRTLEIAREAGVNESLILRYFGGKEGLLTAVLKDDDALQALLAQHQNTCSDADAFPIGDGSLVFKTALSAFFENAKAIVEAKESFMRISSSRALVDEEMASVVRQRLMERQSLALRTQIESYFQKRGKNVPSGELDSLVMLISSTNYVMNFMARKVLKVDPIQIDHSLELLSKVLDQYYQ